MRHLDANADMAAGDLLTTSGVDGIYPPGLQVARVLSMESRADSAFAHIAALHPELTALRQAYAAAGKKRSGKKDKE